ncbi:MAG TPA: hypothetical protein VEU96_08135 [Bryobacteraceae bacterium]|nr:hypothetical protein [Bryobacteraceae bacterium]
MRRHGKQFAEQTARFIALAKRYDQGTRKRIEAVDGVGGEFLAANLDERERILEQLENGSHPVFRVPSARKVGE